MSQIAKYALEHGNHETAKHFLDTQGIEVPESTIRGLRDKYLMKNRGVDGGDQVRGDPTRDRECHLQTWILTLPQG